MILQLLLVKINFKANDFVDDKVDILIAFSQDAHDFFSSKVKPKGLIFVNSDLVKSVGKHGNIFKISASTIAIELKNEKILNMVMLGALIKITNRNYYFLGGNNFSYHSSFQDNWPVQHK